MKSIDLLTQRQHIYFHSQLRFLRSDELCYIRLESLVNISVQQRDFILAATARSQQVILSIPIQDFNNTEILSYYVQNGVRGFSARVVHDVKKDQELVEWFLNYKELLGPDHILVFEFTCPSDDTRGLGATILKLYEHGMTWWVVLNVEDAPDDERSQNYRDLFDYLRIRNLTRINIYFPFWSEFFEAWDLMTQNTFSGLKHVHIDLSNKCTHSCEFCGMYGADVTKERKAQNLGMIPPRITEFLSKEIPREKCLSIIQGLPWSVSSLQFGGLGDPLMHKDALEFIAIARNRGFKVEVLSNLEYLAEEEIVKLHELGGTNLYDLHFIVNISGATPETYVKTRPKQTEKIFQQVVATITELSRMRRRSMNSGVNFTLMCVVTSNNCHELAEMVELAKETGARKVWFKPMEIHYRGQEKYVPKEAQMPRMVKSMRRALELADEHKVEIVYRNYCEEILSRFSSEADHA